MRVGRPRGKRAWRQRCRRGRAVARRHPTRCHLCTAAKASQPEWCRSRHPHFLALILGLALDLTLSLALTPIYRLCPHEFTQEPSSSSRSRGASVSSDACGAPHLAGCPRRRSLRPSTRRCRPRRPDSCSTGSRGEHVCACRPHLARRACTRRLSPRDSHTWAWPPREGRTSGRLQRTSLVEPCPNAQWHQRSAMSEAWPRWLTVNPSLEPSLVVALVTVQRNACLTLTIHVSSSVLTASYSRAPPAVHARAES